MTLEQVVKYEIGPPAAYAIGVLMMVSSLVIITKVTVASRSDMGWKRTSLISRWFDTGFALFFIIRALMIFCGGSLSPIVVFLAFAGLLREVNGFREYRRESQELPQASVAISNLMHLPEPSAGIQPR